MPLILKKDRPAFTLVEFLLVLCIIFILYGTFAMYAAGTIEVAKKVALQNELLNIRMSIEYYRIINGRAPQDLRDLVKKTLTSKTPDGSIIKDSFIKGFRINEDGDLLDPFMKKYVYDNATGRAWSQTKGCEGW